MNDTIPIQIADVPIELHLVFIIHTRAFVTWFIALIIRRVEQGRSRAINLEWADIKIEFVIFWIIVIVATLSSCSGQYITSATDEDVLLSCPLVDDGQPLELTVSITQFNLIRQQIRLISQTGSLFGIC